MDTSHVATGLGVEALAPSNTDVRGRLTGNLIIGELLRNMELGRFELEYSVLLPCVFNLYLHPDDHTRLAGVLPLVIEDARRALWARVNEMNRRPLLSGPKARRTRKQHKIASDDFRLSFFADAEGAVPPGDVEIHSELNDASQPVYQGLKTTLLDREPSVTGAAPRTHETQNATRAAAENVFAEIRYEDDSGPQLFLITQNQIRVGRGGDDLRVDLALYTNDEVSREHLIFRRDPVEGGFTITDNSTNGTWVNGKRLKRGEEERLPERAQIGVAEVLTLSFELRK